MEDRIRYTPLHDKITDPATAARHIGDGTNLFISGFTAGYPKLIPMALVRRAIAGERFKVNLFAGASTGDSVDGILAEAGLVNWRRPYMSDRIMRAGINADKIKFKDDHLSRLAGQVRDGNWGTAHNAVVEAVAVTAKGNLIPTMSVGNTPTYVREAEKIIIEDDFYNDLDIYSEVLQDTVLDLIDLGKVRAASGSSLTLSHKARKRFFDELYRYKEKVVLRPVEISNSPEVIRRLGVIAINTAIEVDIYGHVNSTHLMGSQLVNGIGGSGDFLRNGALTIIVTPSTAKGGKISAIVPMVSHVDHNEHSVDVVVTEHGLVDTRPLTPRQVAEAIIKNCADPQFRPMLWDYYQRAVHAVGGHEPHLLGEVFDMHERFMATGDMRA